MNTVQNLLAIFVKICQFWLKWWTDWHCHAAKMPKDYIIINQWGKLLIFNYHFHQLKTNIIIAGFSALKVKSTIIHFAQCVLWLWVSHEYRLGTEVQQLPTVWDKNKSSAKRWLSCRGIFLGGEEGGGLNLVSWKQQPMRPHGRRAEGCCNQGQLGGN